MKRHELWRQQYRHRRYMEHLTEIDLQHRAREVFNNLILLNDEAKISLPAIRPDSEVWMILWTHVLEEFAIRFGAYPAGFASGFMKDVRIPDPRNSLASKAANAIKTTLLPKGEYLFKYSKAKYLRETMEDGVLRVSPAASYADPSLNPAIRDEELELSVCPLPSEVKINVYCGNTGTFKEEIEPKNIVFTSQSKTNYYVYCLSLSFAPRLFLDFDADACLVIRNPSEFREILLSRFEDKMPGWNGWGQKVTYIDPLNCPTHNIDVYLSKHFRYAYQREYRLVWLPYETKQELDAVFIGIPNIEEYCYLVDLSKT